LFAIFASAVSHSIGLMCCTLVEPILGLQLSQYHLSIPMIGFIFSILALSYSIGSGSLYLLGSHTNYRLIQLTGLIILVIALMCEGPAYFFP
jgi:hypothetical protein